MLWQRFSSFFDSSSGISCMKNFPIPIFHETPGHEEPLLTKLLDLLAWRTFRRLWGILWGGESSYLSSNQFSWIRKAGIAPIISCVKKYIYLSREMWGVTCFRYGSRSCFVGRFCVFLSCFVWKYSTEDIWHQHKWRIWKNIWWYRSNQWRRGA